MGSSPCWRTSGSAVLALVLGFVPVVSTYLGYPLLIAPAAPRRLSSLVSAPVPLSTMSAVARRRTRRARRLLRHVQPPSGVRDVVQRLRAQPVGHATDEPRRLSPEQRASVWVGIKVVQDTGVLEPRATAGAGTAGGTARSQGLGRLPLAGLLALLALVNGLAVQQLVQQLRLLRSERRGSLLRSRDHQLAER